MIWLAAPALAAGLEVQVSLRADELGAGFEARPAATKSAAITLSSCARFLFVVKPSQDVYLYAAYAHGDAPDRVTGLWPTASGAPVQVSAGMTATIPGADLDRQFFLYLGTETGIEHVYLLASPTALSGADLARMARPPEASPTRSKRTSSSGSSNTSGAGAGGAARPAAPPPSPAAAPPPRQPPPPLEAMVPDAAALGGGMRAVTDGWRDVAVGQTTWTADNEARVVATGTQPAIYHLEIRHIAGAPTCPTDWRL